MIIESLRLFYHIKCFKCCVCRYRLFTVTVDSAQMTVHSLQCTDDSAQLYVCLLLFNTQLGMICLLLCSVHL